MPRLFVEGRSVAVLVTGEIRNCRTALGTLPELEQGSDSFISVWQRVGCKIEGWIGPWQVERLLDDAIAMSLPAALSGLHRLERFLPDFFQHLRSFDHGSVSARDFASFSRHVDVEDQRLHVETLAAPAYKTNARFIHYKLARALSMMRLAEQERGKHFDFVMRVRPDLEYLPGWNGEFQLGEIGLDWFKHDPLSKGHTAGDNAIVAARDVMIALEEHLRSAIYERGCMNIHAMLAEFVTSQGLAVRELIIEIGSDRWSPHAFRSHLAERALMPGGELAAEFLSCIRAHDEIDAGLLEQAEDTLNNVKNASASPALLARGRLALARSEMEEVDRLINKLLLPGLSETDDDLYFSRKLEKLRRHHGGAL